MTRFYVRVEGVNLSNFVYETQDLSTIRGGSLLLLEAVGAVEDWLRSKCGRVDPISTGASSGLFDCEADGMTAEEVCGFVRGELGKHPDFRHATIAVDALAAGAGKSFESIREQTA